MSLRTNLWRITDYRVINIPIPNLMISAKTTTNRMGRMPLEPYFTAYDAPKRPPTNAAIIPGKTKEKLTHPKCQNIKTAPTLDAKFKILPVADAGKNA